MFPLAAVLTLLRRAEWLHAGDFPFGNFQFVYRGSDNCIARFDHGCTSTPHSIPSAANAEHSASDVEASQEERLRFSFALDIRNKNGNIAGPLVFAYPSSRGKQFIHKCVV